MEQRPHFSYAVYDLRRWRWLLLLPVARLAVAAVGGLPPTLRWYEAALSGALVAYAFLKWWCCRYRMEATLHNRFHTIGVRQGVVCRRALHIAAEDAASVEVERTPLLWLLGGRRVRVNTAGLRRRSDAQLYLSASCTRTLFSPEEPGQRYRAQVLPVLVLSLTGSNAAFGLLTVAPVLRHSGRLLGQPLAPDVIGWAEQLITLGVPMALRVVANALLIGWGVAVVRNFTRYIGFRAHREGGHLHLVSGWLTRRDVMIDCHKITALELRQTLAMRIFSLHTAVITAAGYGRDRGTRPVLVPAARARELSSVLDGLLPDYPLHSGYLRPTSRTWRRYVAAPVAVLVGGGVLWTLGAWWHAVALLCLVGGAWWLAVRLYGFFGAGVGCGREAVSLCYSRGLALYRVYLPREVVDCVTITRSPWQRRRGECTVRFRCFGEKRRTHRVWGLPYEALCREIARL